MLHSCQAKPEAEHGGAPKLPMSPLCRLCLWLGFLVLVVFTGEVTETVVNPTGPAENAAQGKSPPGCVPLHQGSPSPLKLPEGQGVELTASLPPSGPGTPGPQGH